MEHVHIFLTTVSSQQCHDETTVFVHRWKVVKTSFDWFFWNTKKTFLRQPKIMILRGHGCFAAIKSADSATLGLLALSCVFSDSYSIGEAGEWPRDEDLICKMLQNDTKTDPGDISCFVSIFVMLLRPLEAQNCLTKPIFGWRYRPERWSDTQNIL